MRGPGGRAVRAGPALPAADDDEAGGGEDGDGGAAHADRDQHGDQGHVRIIARRPAGVVKVLPAEGITLVEEYRDTRPSVLIPVSRFQ